MKSRLPRPAFAVLASLGICLLFGPEARSQKKPMPKGKAEELLKPAPRPRRPELPASKLPLAFIRANALPSSATRPPP